MVSLTIHDRTATGRPVDSFTLDDLPDRITVRELIRTRVREEVARYNLRAAARTGAEQPSFRGLVTPVEEERDRNGPRADRSAPRRVVWEAQAAVAVDAFGRNGFFVLVNGRQALDLEEEVELTGASDVAFVRLVQLVGG